MSIDDLAIMVAKGFDRLETKITIVERRVCDVEDLVKVTRHDILDVGDKFISRMEFDSLLVRFNKIEHKVMSKNGK